MRKSGFTLAEVLITLVIIGVIAAMTVPTLMNNTNSQEFRSALKKAISALNQAVTMHYALEGELVSEYNSEASVVSNIFAARLNVINSAAASTALWATTESGSDCSGGQVFITADGISYCIVNFASANDASTGACDNFGNNPCTAAAGPNVLIDVNGLKKPNKLTTSSNQPKDVYQAQLYSQRVIPFGEATQQVMYDHGLN